ncbi:MAG: L-seryl-tRNA(Sec) selenium transferase [Gemmatimonadota bacterium]
MSDPRRQLPSVDRLLALPAIQKLASEAPRSVLLDAIRSALDEVRSGATEPPGDWANTVRAHLTKRLTPSLRPVLNATGIVLHTNLGRAPLAPTAIAAMVDVARGYSTLEFDLTTGRRGSLAEHCGPLLATLAGAAAGLVVNNAAAALVLALNAHADGREVLISRGELIEIGGAFRIPDILEKSGATLREVGTTNRTHVDDYRKAISDRTGAILTVHRSNFEQRGYVTTPDPATIGALAQEHGLPFLHDLGSGLMMDLSPWGLSGEPLVRESMATGADLVIFSGDKLLGGPQAGCLVGTRAAIASCRANPHARAARADKLTLAALEATLSLYHDPERARAEIPILAMLTADAGKLATRAAQLHRRVPHRFPATLQPGESAVGGGSFPTAVLPTTLVALAPGQQGADALSARLRSGSVPLITRIADGLVLLDCRTLLPGTEDLVIQALEAAAE